MTEFDLSVGWYWLVIGAVVCYFIGCVHFAILIAKFKKIDILKEGSGNPGAMNISRRLGLKVGLVNFFFDALKGVVPVLVGHFAFQGMVFKGTDVYVSDFMRLYLPLFAVIGHVFPVFLKFKGGKGISTTVGLLWTSVACENAWFALIGLAAFILLFVYVYFTEWGSMASLLGVSGFTIWQIVIFILRYHALGCLSNVYVILTFMILLLMNVITWGAHNRNIYRLLMGEEHHTSLKSMISKMKKS